MLRRKVHLRIQKVRCYGEKYTAECKKYAVTAKCTLREQKVQLKMQNVRSEYKKYTSKCKMYARNTKSTPQNAKCTTREPFLHSRGQLKTSSEQIQHPNKNSATILAKTFVKIGNANKFRDFQTVIGFRFVTYTNFTSKTLIDCDVSIFNCEVWQTTNANQRIKIAGL
jgi:hypothetical protein